MRYPLQTDRRTSVTVFTKSKACCEKVVVILTARQQKGLHVFSEHASSQFCASEALSAVYIAFWYSEPYKTGRLRRRWSVKEKPLVSVPDTDTCAKTCLSCVLASLILYCCVEPVWLSVWLSVLNLCGCLRGACVCVEPAWLSVWPGICVKRCENSCVNVRRLVFIYRCKLRYEKETSQQVYYCSLCTIC
jgi:hypothetical protein